MFILVALSKLFPTRRKHGFVVPSVDDGTICQDMPRPPSNKLRIQVRLRQSDVVAIERSRARGDAEQLSEVIEEAIKEVLLELEAGGAPPVALMAGPKISRSYKLSPSTYGRLKAAKAGGLSVQSIVRAAATRLASSFRDQP